MEQIQTLHPKATHHCYAYRFGLDKQINYRANDDGEPAGTAGKPILGQIDSKGLTNIIVIIVRYFGGTKLGVPGLISAYKTATANLLNNAQIVQRQVKHQYQIQFAYLQMNAVMQTIKRCETASITQQNFDNECLLKISISQADSQALLAKLQDIDAVEIQLLGII